MNFEIELEDGERGFISVHRIAADRFLCLAAKTSGKGKYIRNPPSGWEIRKDPQDDAYQGQPEHYHCERTTDGLEIVIRADGGASHDTKSGDRIPKKLGNYLSKNLGVAVKKDANDKHVIRLICRDPWDFYFPPFHVDLIASLWNLPATELADSDGI